MRFFIKHARVSAICIAALGCFCFYLGMTALGKSSALTERGYQADGTVVELLSKPKRSAKPSTSDPEDMTFSVRFAFDDADGNAHAYVTAVPYGYYQGLSAGSKIEVTYLPEDPETNRLVRGWHQKGGMMMIAVSLISLVVAGVVYGASILFASSRPKRRFS